jgi:hypothetical protein
MMICRHPGTRTSSRVRSSAGGLLLLLTVFSFLAWETALASSDESKSKSTAATATATATTTASGGPFEKDGALSSPAEKAEKTAAMARNLDLRRAEDLDWFTSKRHRSLGTLVGFANDTTTAPLSAGNNNTACGGLSDCINGCRSHFYKVTGGTGGGRLCGNVLFDQLCAAALRLEGHRLRLLLFHMHRYVRGLLFGWVGLGWCLAQVPGEMVPGASIW